MDESIPPPGRSPGRGSSKSLKTGELAIIEQMRRRSGRLPGSPALRLGIGDDCAILRPAPEAEIVVTTDFSLEGRHFRRDWHSPEAIGHRTLARGLSDLAAMGAKPLAAFLSLAIPRNLAAEPAWLNRVFDGLFALAAATATPLAGGDTSESPTEHLLADIVLLGQLPGGTALRRDAARPGDRLYVTGSLGGSAAELARLPKAPRRNQPASPSVAHPNPHPHLFPSPRLAVGQSLRRRGLAHACLDLSDGLSSDLRRLCEASRVAAIVDADRLPIHPLAKVDADGGLESALHGGEDYELLFSAPAKARMPRRIAGVAVTEVGRLVQRRRGRPTVSLRTGDRESPLLPGGWEHLR